MTTPPPFMDAAREFDPAPFAAGAAAAKQQREAVVEQFPRADWPTLPVERYAVGQGDVATFCRWVEYRSDDLGSIAGGSALKVLISRNAKTGTWRFPERYGSLEQAWSDVRAGFARAFELADQGKWEAISSIEALRGAGALRTKALHIYFPDDVLPVYSKTHLEHYYKLVTGEEAQGSRLVSSRAILKRLREHPRLASLSTYFLGRFLYGWADPREQVRITKIAPGEGAMFWDDCRTNGYICVGWDAIGDLRQFEDKSDFRAAFEEQYRETYKTKSKRTEKANELWTLLELEPGDILIANEGQSRVLAVGQVIEPGYQWSDRSKYRHTVRVKWDTSYEQPLATPIKSWATRTVAKVTPELYQQIVGRKPSGGDRVAFPIAVTDPFLAEIGAALERKGQVVLDGPPGTGKTYSARRFAVDFLLAGEGRTDRAAVLADPARFEAEERRLSTSRTERPVFWVVANPNEWSWDRLFDDGRVDFRRGRIRKHYDQIRAGDLVVGYASNPTKRVLALAKVARVSPDSDEVGFTLEPLRRISQGPTWDELRDHKVLSASEPLRFNCQGTLFKLSPLEAHALFERIAEGDPSFEDPLETAEGVGPLTRLTFHPSYSYEDFIEGFRPIDTGTGGLALSLQDGVFKRLCRAALARPGQRFLMLVDEINRANIAKVFGELITVIEKDKRGLSVTLPQSRQDLVIPPNVFLLGTMNSADRSIKLIDAALRRRFAFMELLPDVEPLKGAEIEGLALDDFLEELNRRIVKREGREKQIGQSFLLEGTRPIGDAAEFARRFRYEILPLLQEYCHDNYGALAEYLGTTLVDADAQRLDETILDRPATLIEVLDKALLGQADESA